MNALLDSIHAARGSEWAAFAGTGMRIFVIALLSLVILWLAHKMEEVEIVGVENWADSAVILRCRFKVAPLEQWNVRREYLRRLKAAFDAAGIEIPFPHLTVYAGEPKAGAAAPFRLAGETHVIESERTAGRQT